MYMRRSEHYNFAHGIDKWTYFIEKNRKKDLCNLCQLQLLCGYLLHSWESFLHSHSSLEVCVK